MKTVRAKLVMAVMFVQAIAAASYADNRSEMVEEMMFMDIPQVVTASKSEQSIVKAPSVMTVITADDIKKWGVRSLEEALRRGAPGFYPTQSQDWNILASRGVVSDINHLYLFLIDGHSINSINGWGPANQQVIPTLDDVDRIEIIRGPGSTMWGADACMATINMITKKGKDINGLKTSFSYSNTDFEKTLNVMLGHGNKEKGIDYMASFTYFDGEGYGDPTEVSNQDHRLGAPYSSTNTVHNASYMTMGNYEEWRPSWEFYGKATVDKFTLNARTLRWTQLWPSANKPYIGSIALRNMDNSFAEASYVKDFTDNTSLESKLFTDITVKESYPIAGAASDEAYKEIGAGAETILRSTLADKHHLQFGLKVVSVEAGPNTTGAFFSTTTLVISSTNTAYLKTESGRDTTYSAYLEDQYSPLDYLTFVLGGRVDKNDYRENSYKFLPRFAAIYNPNAFAVKYAMNSGYYRPSLRHGKNVPSTRGALTANAQNSMSSFSHDLEFMYNSARNHSSLTFYYMTMTQLINTVSASGPLVGGYYNIGDITTYGIEIDFRQKVLNKLDLYGNYAYARARISNYLPASRSQIEYIYTDEDEELLTIPRHIYNIGLDWGFWKGCNLNLHLRGWREGEILNTAIGKSGNYYTFYGEEYVDANILYENIFGLPVSLSVFCTNLFNHLGQDPVRTNFMDGWQYQKERTVGFKASYTF